MPSVETIFMFVVVETCKDCNGNITATILATRMWSSKKIWGFNGYNAWQKEYKKEYEKNIEGTSNALRSDVVDIDKDGKAILGNQHNVTLVKQK
jgi:hypothetical protein